MNSCEVGEYLFTAMGVVDRGQHRHGKSYPWWTSSTNSRIEGRIETFC